MLENVPMAQELQVADPAAEYIPPEHGKQMFPERYFPASQTIAVQVGLPAVDVCPEEH